MSSRMAEESVNLTPSVFRLLITTLPTPKIVPTVRMITANKIIVIR